MSSVTSSSITVVILGSQYVNLLNRQYPGLVNSGFSQLHRRLLPNDVICLLQSLKQSSDEHSIQVEQSD